MKFLTKFHRAFENAANSWSMREWIMLTGAMLIVGILCMRGYGSRKNW
jgi:hypothetical protein